MKLKDMSAEFAESYILGYNNGYKEGYNKAIEDMINKLESERGEKNEEDTVQELPG